jgi:adenine-specific DNA-methyltransferase
LHFETRRALGAFYTPADLAALVTEWAIDRADLDILEPSVGSGALLDAIVKRLSILGGGSIKGFEINPDTMDQLSRFSSDTRVNVERADFFDVPATAGFDLVIANPPFTRNHELTPELRRRLKDRLETREIARGAAGLWVYFLLASLPHLRAGGRLAFVVPGAVEFVDYAKPVLGYLCEQFTSVELIAIDSAVSWEGEAQERASVLLASGFRRGRTTSVQTRRTTTDGSIASARDTHRVLPAAEHLTLGSLARVEIGSVTGANDIFLLSDGLLPVLWTGG